MWKKKLGCGGLEVVKWFLGCSCNGMMDALVNMVTDDFGSLQTGSESWSAFSSFCGNGCSDIGTVISAEKYSKVRNKKTTIYKEKNHKIIKKHGLK